jgi:hypothetical protein
MSQRSLSERDGEAEDAGGEVSPWRTLLRLARPFRARSLSIICLAALSTGATVIEPLGSALLGHYLGFGLLVQSLAGPFSNATLMTRECRTTKGLAFSLG